jgi:hypothetical protein
MRTLQLQEWLQLALAPAAEFQQQPSSSPYAHPHGAPLQYMAIHHFYTHGKGLVIDMAPLGSHDMDDHHTTQAASSVGTSAAHLKELISMHCAAKPPTCAVTLNSCWELSSGPACWQRPALSSSQMAADVGLGEPGNSLRFGLAGNLRCSGQAYLQQVRLVPLPQSCGG